MILFQGFLISILLILSSSYMILRRINRQRLFSPVSGLHINILLFWGIGPLSYLFVTYYYNTSLDFIIHYYVKISVYFLIGYLIWDFYEIKRISSIKKNKVYSIVDSKNINPKYNLIILSLGLIGYYLTPLEISSSGFGIVIPLFKLLLYPALIILIISFNFKKSSYALVTVLVFTIAVSNALFSFWRSELLFIILSIYLAFLFKSKKLSVGLTLIMITIMLFVLPFQLERRKQFDKAGTDNKEIWQYIYNLDPIDRILLSVEFLSVRINGGREAAYIVSAIDDGLINYEYGTTYLKTVTQLVPRVIWPSKPSYNRVMGFELPRKIGLLGAYDLRTSWAPTIFPEFLLNFPMYFLILFIPLLFSFWQLLENYFHKLFKTKYSIILAGISFFFVTLNSASIINTATYILWLIILIKILDVNFKSKNAKNTDPNRLVPSRI